MQLVSLEIQNFRVLRSVRIEFGDALVGIIGPNGSGKSTLVEAITWVLYGNQVARSGKDEIKSVFAREAENCEGTLTFKVHDHEYRITRRLAGRHQRPEVELYRDGLSESIGSTDTRDAVTRLLGLDWRGFLTSFLARQQELNALSELVPSKRRDHLAGMLGIERIDRAAQSVKADIKVAENTGEWIERQLLESANLPAEIGKLKASIETLHQAIVALMGAREDSKVRLESLTKVLREHETKKLSCSQIEAGLEAEEKTRKLLVEQVAGARRTLAILDEAERDIQRIAPTLAELEVLRAEFERLREARIRAEQRAGIERQQAEFAAARADLEKQLDSCNRDVTMMQAELQRLPNDLANLVEIARTEVERLRTEYLRLQAQVESGTKEISKLEKSKTEISQFGADAICDRCRRPFGKDLGEIITHLDAELLELKATRADLEPKLAELFQSGTSAKEKLVEVEWKQRIRIEVSAKYDARQKETENLTQNLAHNAGLLQQLKEQLDRLGDVAFDAPRLEDVSKRLKELEALRTRYNQLQGTVANRAAAEAELERAFARVEQAAQTIATLQANKAAVGYSGSDHAAAARAFETARATHVADQDRLTKANHELELTAKELEHRQSLLVTMEQSRKELEKHRTDQFYGETLVRLFGDFRGSLIARIRPRLAELSSRLMSDMTDGRYSMIELDEEYNIRMFDEGTFFGIERFSGGEKDLANLCLRLAISQALAESAGLSRSFVILDEVFASQDESRRELIVRGLANLKNQFPQILLITHIPEIKDMVERVISVQRTTQGWSEVSENGK